MLLFSVESAVAALSPGDLREAQRRGEHVQQRMEERRRILEEGFLRGDEQPPEERVQPLPHVQGEAGAPCVDVRVVRFSGATLVSDSDLARLAAPYENRCLTLNEINNLLRDITNVYIELRPCEANCMQALQNILPDGTTVYYSFLHPTEVEEWKRSAHELCGV